jgi:hypothetical protein
MAQKLISSPVRLGMVQSSASAEMGKKAQMLAAAVDEIV